MYLVRRGDDRAADPFLMIKGGDSVVVPALRTTRLASLVQEGKLALRAEETSTAGPPRSPERAGCLSVRTVAFLLPLLSLLSWNESMDNPAVVD